MRSRSVLPWAVWGTAALLYAVAVINRSSLTALGPATQEHFGIPASTLAMFPMIQLLVYAGCQIPVGVLLDRFGASAMLLAGGVLMMLGQVVMATVSDVSYAIIARVLVGAGDACTFISVMRLLPEWFPPRRLPTLGQATALIGQSGQLVSVTPLAFAVATFGWTAGFLGVVAVGLLLVVFAALVLRNEPGGRTAVERMIGRSGSTTLRSASYAPKAGAPPLVRAPATSSIPVAVRPGARSDGFARRMRVLLSIPGVRLAFWLHFASAFSGHVFMLLWATPFLEGGLGMSPTAVKGLLSIAIVSAMAASVLLGPLATRFAAHQAELLWGISAFIAIGWVVLIVWPGAPPAWLVLAFMLVVPLGPPSSMIGFEVVRAHSPGSYLGIATGFVNTGGFFAAIIGVMVIGVALDLQGAGSPETYSLEAFRVAFAVAILPLAAIGLGMAAIEQRRTTRWVAARRG